MFILTYHSCLINTPSSTTIIAVATTIKALQAKASEDPQVTNQQWEDYKICNGTTYDLDITEAYSRIERWFHIEPVEVV